MRHASGEQHRIDGGGYSAVVAQLGASLRVLRTDDVDLVAPWEADELRPVYRGALLAPWPNRITDGRYSFGGEDHQLPLTEVPRRTAIHGLVVWQPWDRVAGQPDTVELASRVWPQAGYPWSLDLHVRYAVGHEGLTTTLSARNTGSRPAPYGCSAHPYLLAGPGRVDDWSVEVPASEVLEVDADRLVPGNPPRTRGVTGDLDLRRRRPLAGVQLDHAFTGLGGGRVCARVRSGDGSGVEISWDSDVLPWVQVHTADRPEPELDRAGLAVEPMTCPPDAFRSGRDLVVLQPGQEHEASWTVRALPAAPPKGGRADRG